MMKRILPIFVMLMLFAAAAFAQDDSEDGGTAPAYEYKMNGRGDQYIKIAVMANFPLNFGDSLYTGGAAELGYYRFLNSWLAVGGELMVGYNPTLGSNILTFFPITAGVSFLPSVWRFEIPVTLTVGAAYETCQNKKYFPGFAAKAELGVYYRFSESWSFGIGTDFLYLPQWFSTTKGAEADYGIFMTAAASVRYHF